MTTSGGAARYARLLEILSTVIREPGLGPIELAERAGISERTLRRDLDALRHLGYEVGWQEGYQLQESLDLDGTSAPHNLARDYEQQLKLLRQEVGPELAELVAGDVEALAPAALATLFASALRRRLVTGRHRPRSAP